ncbi:MAG: DNA gyrase subunit B, partial [Deltaproteobacteria bacterium]|nr:DNA gyrase subunit B [Deltaproteobacteria bacterium]
MNAASASKEYTAAHIKVLEGLDAVRKRPGMYIGDTGSRGLHHLVYEVVDNSIDEALAGFCDHITVTLHPDKSVTVEDNGRGIPVDIHETEKRAAAEVVMTKLHAGGKFDKKSYQVSGGLHGVGVSVVNALSEVLDLEIKRDGIVYYQQYRRGKPTADLKEIGETTQRGTKIRFFPDKEIFEITEFNFDTLTQRLRELAFLNPGLVIDLIDEMSENKHTFFYEGGIVSFVQHLNKNRTMIHPDPLYFKSKVGNVEFELAFQYNDSYNEII